VPRAPVREGVVVPRRLCNAALAQFVLLHLTALGGRQLAHEFRLLDLSEHRLDHLLRMSLNTGHEMAAIRGQNLFVVGQSR
jgi:hypothetical protein